MRVLYVEDSTEDVELTRRVLVADNPLVIVTHAASLADARRLLALDGGVVPPFDVLLVDVGLPDGSGLELLEAVRSHGVPAAVVMLTGSGDPELPVASLRSGADDYLTKRADYLDALPGVLKAATERFRSRLERHRKPLRVLYVGTRFNEFEQTKRQLARSFTLLDVQVVRDAAEALACLSGGGAGSGESRYDALLVEYDLPGGLDGLELVRALRKRDQAVPTVLIADRGREEIAAQALKLGVDDYLIRREGFLFELPLVLENVRRQVEMLRERRMLQESERRFRTLFEQTSAISVQGYDSRRRVIFWNRASEVMYGYSSREAMGQPIEELILPDSMREYAISSIDAWVKGEGEIPASELTLKRRDGSPVHVFSSHVMLRNTQGETEMYCVDVDLSEQKRASQRLALSEARYRQVVDNVNEVIFQTDAQGRWSFLNPAWEGLTGLRVEEALGRPFIDFVFPDDRPRLMQALRPLIERQVDFLREEVRYLGRDGRVRRVEVLARLGVADGGVSGTFGTLSDVTERADARTLQLARNEVLNRLVSDEPLRDILDCVARHVEAILAGTRVAIMLLDPVDGRLRGGAAPSLPPAFVEAVDGLPCADGVGCCGSAAACGGLVVTEDIATDPAWQAWRGAALAAGLRSCWSQSFKDESGGVLGTFAVYRDTPHLPDEQERALVSEFVNLSSVAVQKKHAAGALQQREAALEMSAYAALELLREPDLDTAIHKVLESLALNSGVDRAYIFENARENGILLSSLRHEWLRAGVASLSDYASQQAVPLATRLPRWASVLDGGGLIKGLLTALPADEQAHLGNRGVLSLLVAPIFVKRGFWGFIGFENMSWPRPWRQAEEHVLHIVLSSLSAAIERKEAMDTLRRAATAFESMREGVVITDLTPRIVAVNRAYTQLTGYSEEEVLGENPRFIRSGRQDRAFYQDMWRSLKDTGHWQGEIWNRHRDGEVQPQMLTISTVRDEFGEPTHYVGVMTDISQIKRSEAEVARLAHYDPLTGLPNRLLGRLRLEHALEQATRHTQGVGVLVIDLDRFKNVNDSLGHPVGDSLLVKIAERLRQRLHAEDTLARLGGDEFMMVIEHLPHPDEAGQLAQAVLGLMDEALVLDEGREIYVGVSIGISVYPEDGNDATQLLQRADTAMHQAKAQGRGTYRYFTAGLSEAALHRLALETRLRRALERNEMELHYQPQIDLASGLIVGCEALLRWQDGEFGSVSPSRFIPISEESDLIVTLGEWALHTACRQAAQWRAAGLPPLVMAVNLSMRQLQQPELPARVGAILQQTGLPPACLELELTESMIMGQEAVAEARLRELKALGIKLAIDDFGTGYSSLAYLKRFPIDVLKIDRSFVEEIPSAGNDMEIAAAIVAMGRSLKLRVVAEGVESEAQLAFLKAHRCDVCQGFLFSRPLTATAFEAFVRRDGGRVAVGDAPLPGC